MFRLITVATALTVLVACDSEGIDRSDTGQTSNNTIVFDDESGTATGSTSESTDPNTGSEQDTVEVINAAPVTPADDTDLDTPVDVTGSGNETPTVPAEDEVNSFGGSGSSDGGNNTIPADDAEGEDLPEVDASLDTTPPESGTTFVSTMSPITSENGPLCLRPMRDEDDNIIYNERGNCPLVEYHGNLAFGDFILATNAWNYCASTFEDWEQCVTVEEVDGAVVPRWDYDWGEENQVNGQVWLVKSYPEIIYGVKSPGEYSGSTLAETPAETGLPAKVSDMPFYSIDYAFTSEEYPTRGKNFNGERINGERNIAVEAFFHELSGDCEVDSLVRNGTSSNQRYEIMVWLDAGAERLPASANDYVTTQTLDGIEYDIYTKPTDLEYIAFVSKTPTDSGTLNWTTFVEWTRANAHRVNEVFGQGSNTNQLDDDWCMANILLGTEIWWGNGYFQADDWTITRTVR